MCVRVGLVTISKLGAVGVARGAVSGTVLDSISSWLDGRIVQDAMDDNKIVER